MKILDIALKDQVRFLRSMFLVVMAVVAPLLMTGLFYLAFGRASQGGGFDVPLTRVQVVNLDQGSAQAGGFVAGQLIVDVLRDESLAEILQVTLAPDEAAARGAMERQEADVAVIIPRDLTARLFTAGEKAAITMIHDPTLTLGPGIVKGLLNSLTDALAGGQIASQVAAERFRAQGLDADGALARRVSEEYAQWVAAQGARLQKGESPGLELVPPGARSPAASQRTPIAAQIMQGMMIFFVFFTAAAAAETIITEDEEGTLQRLFTTPTPRGVILGGKLLTVFITVLVQVIVLLLSSALIFKINWGRPVSVLLMALAMVIAAAGFGVFIMSFIKSTRQSGPIMGGVLTVTGALGGLLTPGIQNLPAFYTTLNLFTPHGWAMRGWTLAVAGGTVGELLVPLMALVLYGAATFAVGVLLFRKRFA